MSFSRWTIFGPFDDLHRCSFTSFGWCFFFFVKVQMPLFSFFLSYSSDVCPGKTAYSSFVRNGPVSRVSCRTLLTQ